MQDKNKREKCEGALQQPRPWDVAGILSVSPGRNDLFAAPHPLAKEPGLVPRASIKSVVAVIAIGETGAGDMAVEGEMGTKKRKRYISTVFVPTDQLRDKRRSINKAGRWQPRPKLSKLEDEILALLYGRALSLFQEYRNEVRLRITAEIGTGLLLKGEIAAFKTKCGSKDQTANAASLFRLPSVGQVKPRELRRNAELMRTSAYLCKEWKDKRELLETARLVAAQIVREMGLEAEPSAEDLEAQTDKLLGSLRTFCDETKAFNRGRYPRQYTVALQALSTIFSRSGIDMKAVSSLTGISLHFFTVWVEARKKTKLRRRTCVVPGVSERAVRSIATRMDRLCSKFNLNRSD